MLASMVADDTADIESNEMICPRRPGREAAVTAPGAGCEPGPFDFLGCADAVSGRAAAAPPKKAMNSRLFIVASVFHRGYLAGLASISVPGLQQSCD
jgi:hypothetical protein